MSFAEIAASQPDIPTPTLATTQSQSPIPVPPKPTNLKSKPKSRSRSRSKSKSKSKFQKGNFIWRLQKSVPDTVQQFVDSERAQQPKQQTKTFVEEQTSSSSLPSLPNTAYYAVHDVADVISSFHFTDVFTSLQQWLLTKGQISAVTVSEVTSENRSPPTRIAISFDLNSLDTTDRQELEKQLTMNEFDITDSNSKVVSTFQLLEIPNKKSITKSVKKTVTTSREVHLYEIETLYRWWFQDGEEVLAFFESQTQILKVFNDEVEYMMRNSDTFGKFGSYVTVYIVLETTGTTTTYSAPGDQPRTETTGNIKGELPDFPGIFTPEIKANSNSPSYFRINRVS